MSFKALKWAFSQNLPTYDYLILLVLANHAAKDTDICWPSIEQIMYKCRCSKNTVLKSIRNLIDLNLITKEEISTSNGKQLRNNYRLNMFINCPEKISEGFTTCTPEGFTTCTPRGSPHEPEGFTTCTAIEPGIKPVKYIKKNINKKSSEKKAKAIEISVLAKKRWEEDFFVFWKKYPVQGGRKGNKKLAKKVWMKIPALDKNITLEKILLALENQVRERLFESKLNPTFERPWKMASTWLNGECWNDEVASEHSFSTLDKKNETVKINRDLEADHDEKMHTDESYKNFMIAKAHVEMKLTANARKAWHDKSFFEENIKNLVEEAKTMGIIAGKIDRYGLFQPNRIPTHQVENKTS